MTIDSPNIDQLNEFIKSLNGAKLPFFTFLGAFTLYLMNRLQNSQPFSLFTAINIDIGPDASPPTILGDMFLSSIIGTLVIIPLTGPATVPQAIVAGLGMTGILSAHAKQIGEAPR